MDNEIRICFSLFVSHMKQTLKNLPEYDYNTITSQQIKSEMEVIYMKYILSSSFSISESSVGVVAYKHLKKMVDDNEKKSKYNTMESDLKIIALENTILKQELNELKNKISTTLFPINPFLSSQQNQLNSTNQQTSTNQQPKGWFS